MIHTSPLEQPGSGDAGGMNVYVVESARRMAEAGAEVDIFTRATSSQVPSVVDLFPGVKVHHLIAGPFQGLAKEELPGQFCALSNALMREEANHSPGHYDLIHSHYWLSGQVGWVAAERWNVPLVHTMHTMAKVKNAALAEGDRPEPNVRAIGEEQVVSAADALIANTEAEAASLVGLYDANPDKVHVVAPGVDLETFTPGNKEMSRMHIGVPKEKILLTFVGRIQPHKGPDTLIKAAAEMIKISPVLRNRLKIAVLGGASGNTSEPARLRELAAWLGISDLVHFGEPSDRNELPHWYRSSDLVVVPSHSESFGLVALEAQACGTPVVATAVGGLRTAVSDGISGVLVDGHDPRAWASVLVRLVSEPDRRKHLAIGAIEHAQRFGWRATAENLLEIYEDLLRKKDTSRALA